MEIDVEGRRRTRKRLLMPIVHNQEFNATTPFETHSGLRIANGFTRVVIGDRGAYIEFDDEQIVEDNLRILPSHWDSYELV